ncbi:MULTISPECIES: hypothetical protein [unclassified Streptomyces]|uniref:hypothetical protein n=1 Tax=unclassified Streptomyces TaxID=2593676 RepID=UPI0006AE3BD6|nr:MULTISPECIES: hypothetical protein [unclassified Streptomyces]KOX24665.1 hypothetical protein ADL06_21310 [Streptomyces sp. NRRL F-6491]KOX40428.1 hypothetical protein ADL08_22270 [Streptomyces sp. NRRL F-6492]
MAALGQVRETFWEGCTPEDIKFATEFRALVNAMTSPKQHVRARQLGIAPSTLSNYWIGRRIPWQARLHALFAAARKYSAGDEPVTLAALEKLRAYARLNRLSRDSHAASVIWRLPDGMQVSGTDAPAPGTVPATGPAQDRQSTGNAGPLENGENPETPGNSLDRRDQEKPEIAESGAVGETLGILRAARASEDLRHLVGTAWSASRTFSEAEFCAAVAALHATGDTDLAEALLLADGQRGPDATMRLALALMGAGLGSSAELVMRASLPAEASLVR